MFHLETEEADEVNEVQEGHWPRKIEEKLPVN